MSEQNKDFAGKNGFTWWVGIVEDRQDPLKMGRVRVRCVGWHADNKMQLPTDQLPWSMPMLPVNNPHPYAPKEGDMVFGFFTDGEAAQEPVVMGVFPGVPLKEANAQQAFSDPRVDELVDAPRPPQAKVYNTDGSGIEIEEKVQADSYPNILDEPSTSRIARNETIEKTFIEERKTNVVTGVETVNSTWDEPETKYDAKYPYNNVTETESGHIVEFDDTYQAERIHVAHRNGSFFEMFPDGDKVTKVTKDNYEIIMGDHSVYIMGKCNITVQGDAEVYVKENAYIKVDKDVEATVGQNMTATIGENMTAEVGGNYDLNISGTCHIKSGGTMKLNAPTIDLNDGSQGAARVGDSADTGDQGTGGHYDNNSAGSDSIESGSGTVLIGG